MTRAWDVLVVGGGPAGLSAALVLGRCRRRVLVCDAGPRRNQASRAVHGFLSRDGIAPMALLAQARADLARYRTVRIRKARVTRLRRQGRGFVAALGRRSQVRARRVLLATGVQDTLPSWPGLARFYGRSVFHCPYCDAWELRDRRLAVWGETRAAAGLALKLTSWSRSVVLLTGGEYVLSSRLRARLRAHGVGVRTEPIVGLRGRGRQLSRVEVAGGTPVSCDAVFLAVGQRQACGLFERLGCKVARSGAIAADRLGRTSVRGLFAAGDATVDTQMVVVAASEGARAAVAINESLLSEDLAD
jgi:thioredoxin reductase